MKIFKFIFALILIYLLISIGYIFKFQQIVNTGSVIADKQCMIVNPFIIKRKNSYLNSMKIISNQGSAEEYMKELKNYLDFSNKFIVAQEKWLKEEKAYLNKWDYNLLMPIQIKELGRLQYNSREADMKGTKAILDMLKTTDINQQKEYVKFIVEEVKIANKADEKYNLIWSKGISPNLIMKFIKVPISICPKENLNIPNVPDLLSPPAQINHGPVSSNSKNLTLSFYCTIIEA